GEPAQAFAAPQHRLAATRSCHVRSLLRQEGDPAPAGRLGYASPIATMYFLASRVVWIRAGRSWRFRLPVLWLSRCFLPAWRRLSLPLAVALKRLREPLCVFIFGIGHPAALSR